MPSAAVKLEKQASTEADLPIKQAITVLEHKIRNLEKRKRKIEIYRDDQSRGQTLNNDQLLAVSKYEEITKTLDFAQDLCKQFNGIALDTLKLAKKQLRKEANERAMQEASRVKEILLVQDILQNMGQENVREDFLAGRNNALQLSEADLKYLDDFYVHVSPKRATVEEGLPTFAKQVTSATEHLLNLVEGKQKEVVGTTYDYLKKLATKINDSGYFDQVPATHMELESPAEALAVPSGIPAVLVDEIKEKLVVVEVEADPVAKVEHEPCTFVQGPKMPAAPLAKSLPIPLNLVSQPNNQPAAVQGVDSYFTTETTNFNTTPLHQTVNELIQTVAGSFNFLQESELDPPGIDLGLPLVPSVVAPLPVSSIPTQTFTNQNFSPATATVPQPQVVFQVPVPELGETIPGFAAATPNPPPPIPMPPSHRTSPYLGGQLPNTSYQSQADYQQAQLEQEQQTVDAMHNLHAVESWTLSDATEATSNSNTEWIQHGNERQGEWSQEQSQPEWSMAVDDSAGFITQNNARAYGGGRGNRGNHSHRGGNTGARGGNNAANSFSNPRTGGRSGSNFQNGGNNRNYNYARNNEGSSGGANNGTYFHGQNQNGYQQRQESYSGGSNTTSSSSNNNNNGNYGGPGQYRGRGNQRGNSGARGGAARGMSNDGLVNNHRGGNRGGTPYAVRPQNSRQ